MSDQKFSENRSASFDKKFMKRQIYPHLPTKTTDHFESKESSTLQNTHHKVCTVNVHKYA